MCILNQIAEKNTIEHYLFNLFCLTPFNLCVPGYDTKMASVVIAYRNLFGKLSGYVTSKIDTINYLT